MIGVVRVSPLGRVERRLISLPERGLLCNYPFNRQRGIRERSPAFLSRAALHLPRPCSPNPIPMTRGPPIKGPFDHRACRWPALAYIPVSVLLTPREQLSVLRS